MAALPDSASHAGPPALRLELLPVETRGQLTLVFRVTGDPRAFRLLPVRDPRQPRFWGLAVVDRFCDVDGVQTPVWAGHWGLERAQLAALIESIRENPDAWLAEPARNGLRAVLTAGISSGETAVPPPTGRAAQAAAPSPAGA